MGRANGIAISASSQRPRQKFIKVTADVGDLRFAKNPDFREIAVLIETGDLFSSQSFWIFRCRRMKSQVALKLIELFRARNELGCRRFIHFKFLSNGPREMDVGWAKLIGSPHPLGCIATHGVT